MAMCVIAVVAVAPCQCFSPGANQTTSPGRISSITPPSPCAHPKPELTISVWPNGCVCHAVRAPGSNVTLAPRSRAGDGASNSGSMRTLPVNHSARPLLDPWLPAGFISTCFYQPSAPNHQLLQGCEPAFSISMSSPSTLNRRTSSCATEKTLQTKWQWFLLRSKQEGVGLAADGAIAGDLTGVVDAIGWAHYPAAFTRDQSIQVLHLAAISRNESMVDVSTRGRETDDGAAIVDRQPPGAGSAERPEVNHGSVAQPKGVRRAVAASVGLSGDFVLVIDRIGNAPTAAERTECSHRTVLVAKSEEVAARIVRIAHNHPKVIDRVCDAGIATECPEIRHLPI